MSVFQKFSLRQPLTRLLVVAVVSLMALAVSPWLRGNGSVTAQENIVTSVGSSARAYASSNEVLFPPAKVPLDAETYDRLGEFSTARSRFTASQAGYYLVSVSAVVEDIGCSNHLFSIRKNGLLHTAMKYIAQGTPENNPQLNVTDIIELATGDYVELWVEQAGCAAVTVFGGTGSDTTFLAIGRLP